MQAREGLEHQQAALDKYYQQGAGIGRWKLDALQRRGLDRPTGEPLYSYRFADDEFKSLEALLRETLAARLPQQSLGQVAGAVSGLAPLFVCYAAEWWRRNYDGSGWTWDPIVAALGADPDDWNQVQRSECVERGLREWFLSLRTASGLRYLGSIAFNGGLPMQLLATARGSIGRVLSRTMQLAATSAPNLSEILDWIESLSGVLPQTYRQREIYALLGEVIVVVLRLRDEAGLQSSASALAQLSERIPSWRNRFPLPVDDEHVRGLIEQLLKDAVQAPEVARRQDIVVERYLEAGQDGQWRLRASLNCPEHMNEAQLKRLFNCDSSALPRMVELVISRGGAVDTLSARRLAGREQYRFERRPVEADGDRAAAEHVIALRIPGEPALPGYVPSASELDREMPWVFVGGGDRSKFLRQGGGLFSPTELIVSVPANLTAPVVTADTSIDSQGRTDDGRTVYRLRGSATWDDGAGSRYRITAGRADADESYIEPSGMRVFNWFLRPSLAFRGTPRIQRVSKEGIARPLTGVQWRRAGSARVEKGPTEPGIWEGRYAPGGELQWRTRVVVLGSAASEQFIPGAGPSGGTIVLSGWGAPAVAVSDQRVMVERRVDGNSLQIDLRCSAAQVVPPECVDLTLGWGASDAIVRLPFPSRGAQIFAADGRPLGAEAFMPAAKLVGARIIGFLGAAPTALLEFSTSRSAQQGRFEKQVRVAPERGTNRAEVRLIDHLPEIHRLIAENDALDAWVRVDVRIEGRVEAQLTIGRYDCALQLDPASQCVMLEPEVMARLSPSQVREAALEAVRLDAIEQEPVALPSVESEGVHTGQWNLRCLTVGGSWLVYPHARSSLLVRPRVCPVGGAADEAHGLQAAMRIADYDERQLQIASAVAALTDWSNPDWRVVELVSSNLGHLPLTALDLWRVIAKSSATMALLGMRITSSVTPTFLERFARELPFMWELVAFGNWRGAMRLFAARCYLDLGPELGEKACRELLKARIDAMASIFPSLRVILSAAAAGVAAELFPEAKGLKPGLDHAFRAALFQGETSSLQNLLHARCEHPDWPTSLRDEVEAAAAEEQTKTFLYLEGPTYRHSVINAPILAALEVLRGSSWTWLLSADKVAKLRKHQSFEPEWFTEAFERTLLRGLCLGTVPTQDDL